MITFFRKSPHRVIVVLESPDMRDLAAARFRSKRNLRFRNRHYIEMSDRQFKLYMSDLRNNLELVA